MVYNFKNELKKWGKNWKKEFLLHKYLIIFSMLFFVLAIIISQYASNYVDKVTTVVVPDLILNHIPTLDLDFIFVYGLIGIIFIIGIYTIFFKVGEFHRVIGQFSLLILIRSFFIVLTHLGKPAGALVLDSLPSIYHFFNFYNDLFFSSHTAIPFMAFLVFKNEKIGIFFLIMSIVMAVTVLFMHVHYSIDVFSAFFITYGTYKIGEWFFRKINHY